MSWDPAQYERFRDERSQPFFDLLGCVEASDGMRAVDLGCGTGDLTRVLHERLRCTSTVGYDNSKEMLDAAAARGALAAGLSFEEADIADLALAPGSVDLVLANASLHWLPDHEALLARLAGWLSAEGQLAVQVPANHDYVTHTLARELAARARFAGPLGGFIPPQHVRTPTEYAALLHGIGFRPMRVSLNVYSHLLPSRDGVFEWVRGTTLTGLKSRMTPDLYATFEAEYRAELLRRLPDDRPFFFPFQRILMWGRRATAG